MIRWLPARAQWRWLLLVPIAALAAIIEATGALAVFGLLRLVVDPELVRSTPVVASLLRFSPQEDPRGVVAILALGVGVFYLVRAAYLAWAEWVRQGMVFGSSALASERLLARYLSADYLFHVRRSGASLMENMTRASDVAFELGAGSAITIMAEAITIAALAAVLVISAPPITVVTIAVVLAVVLVPIVFMRRSWERIGETERSLHEQQSHLLQQSLGAVKDVTVTGRQAFFEERFRRIRRHLADVKQRRAAAANLARLGVEATLILSMLLIVFLVMRADVPSGDTVSVLALFAYTGFRVVPSANRIMLNAGYMREASSWIRVMDEDMRRLHPPAVRPFVHEPPMLLRSLTCDHVTFRYEPSSRPALDDVTFTVLRGQSIGIVGPTGAGKSTLVDVLLGLLPPSLGRVLVDGETLEGRERAWQRQIGYVAQDVYLLDDTLRRNIAFGIPDGAIDDARLARALAQARLDDVVASLPQKLETVVGEDGVRLSGGQRQRVAIARALYHDPAVLVFDEATAALDNQTEREVTDAISRMHGERTVIAIAHRLSTVKSCDQLIYLREARVAGIGTYDELMRDPEFRQLT